MAVTVIMEHDTRRFPDGQARRGDRPRRTEAQVIWGSDLVTGPVPIGVAAGGQLLEKLQRFEEEMPFGS